MFKTVRQNFVEKSSIYLGDSEGRHTFKVQSLRDVFLYTRKSDITSQREG